MIKIAPSVLAANFTILKEQLEIVATTGADWIHVDVMDGQFVPNLTFGPKIVKAIRELSDLPLDVHLMVEPVDRIVPDFAKAGANIISFHPEASGHIDRTIGLIKEQGCLAGLVFNPATPLHYLDHVLDKLDLILIMSVNPGFGGQKFIPSVIEKAKRLKALIEKRNPDCLIEVDGGVNDQNVKELEAAGVDVVVAGSFVYKHPEGIEKAISALK